MTSTSAIASSLFILLILTGSYRCDISDSGLASGNINVTFSSINKKISSTSSKSSSSSAPTIDTTNDVGTARTGNNSTTFLTFKSSADDVQTTQQQQQQQSHQIPLVRLPSNTLLKYTAYKDVSIQHFLIPMDSRSVLFSFKAYEESKSALTRVCQPQDVTLHLKAGSYPVISPENITFPKHFLSSDQRYEIHSLQFKSDGAIHRMQIEGPAPGNWFGVAFISWTDPNNERIEQQGLTPACETLLLSEMSIARESSLKMLNEDVNFKDSLHTNSSGASSYKFFVPWNVDICTVEITLTKACDECNDLIFLVQSNSLPTSKLYLQSMIIPANQTGRTIIEFYPHENSWHYADVKFFEKSTANANDANSAAPAGTSPSSSSAAANASSSALLGSHLRTSKAIDNSTTVHIIDFNVTLQFSYKNNIDDAPSNENRLKSENVKDHSSNDADYLEYIPYIAKKRTFVEYPLLRQTYREFFMYDYDLVPDQNGTVPASINMTAGMPALMKFDIGDVYDVGGTLSFAISMTTADNIAGALNVNLQQHSATGSSISLGEQAIAEKLTSDESKPSMGNQTVIVCLRLNEPGMPTWPDKCVYGRQSFIANTIINNTDSLTSTGLIHVPFPETGTWYLSIGLFCHDEIPEQTSDRTARTTIIDSVKTFIRHNAMILNTFQAPCSCAVNLNINFYRECLLNDKCLSSMNETETLKIKECLMDAKCTGEYSKLSRAFDIHHKRATEHSVNGKTILNCQDKSCNTSVAFTLSSNPCVSGRCGRNGRCYHYMSGGFVFSTCLCLKFYRGWDCTEDSQVPSSFSILAASLLLTLSNLLFIPSIYFSIRREYFTEAVIYFFAMFFSTFYHACDSGEEEFSFCLVKISVLQFCDFYCGLLAIWVTLIAMANVRASFVSLLHMLGAILLAFGTELNKQSLWVFLAPALTGICIISVSWGMKCRKKKTLYPSKTYLALYLPLGSVLVMIGLVCYAFLQTKQNYHIVHSIWHMVMALSILCLLPKRIVFETKS